MILVLLMALSQAQPAQDDDRQVGFAENVGEWLVAGDRKLGMCFAQLESGGQTKLSVFARPAQAELTFTVQNPAWRSLQDGKDSRLTARFFSHEEVTDTWDLAVTSYNNSKVAPVLHFTIERATNDGANFIRQFSAAERIEFSNEKVPVAAFELVGSGKAIARLQACRDYLRADPNFDPFAQ